MLKLGIPLIIVVTCCLCIWICMQLYKLETCRNPSIVSSIAREAFRKPHFDEKFNAIDVSSFEVTEQQDSLTFINANDIVLELGARYGTVSTIVNNILSNKTNHVVVEPDLDILDALKLNRNIHNCEFQIYTGTITGATTSKKIVRDGYGTYITDDNDNQSTFDKIESITYQEFKQRYPLNFNVLIMDCEGCAEEFVKTLGPELSHYNKILLERDNIHMSNYSIVENMFMQDGFTKVKDVGLHCIYINFNRL